MKTSIVARTVLAIFCITSTAAYGAGDDRPRSGSRGSAGSAGSAGSHPATPATPATPGLTITSPKLFAALEVGVAILALLAPRDKLAHLLGYEAVLGATSYGATLRGGNHELASRFAGHVGLATGIILVSRMLKTPIEFAVPALTYWLLHRRVGTETLRAMIAKAPALMTRLASLSLTGEQWRAAIASMRTMLSSAPKTK